MDLITPDYLEEQRKLHRKGGYGVSAAKWAPLVHKLGLRVGAQDILDYGSGKGALTEALRAITNENKVYEYDPAIEGKDALPRPADFVVCLDVLEHIEPACIDAVLAHISALTRIALFVVIATRLSENKVLSDGRNAHVLLQHSGWWKMKLEQYGLVVVDPMRKLARPGFGEYRALAVKKQFVAQFHVEAD